METLWQDVKYGARMLAKSPGFTAVAVLTLALGIGANTAIFSVVDALLLKPLPYPQADQLTAVTFQNDQPQGFQFWAYPKYAALRDVQTSFQYIAAYSQRPLTVQIREQPEKAEAEIVTGNYFSLLGVVPALGRAFLSEEDRTPGTHPVVVLGHHLWQQAFGGDPQAIGKIFYIQQQAYTVVGVMPANFRGQSGTAELWAPMMMADQLLYKGSIDSHYVWWLKVIARRKPGVTEEQARGEMPIVSAKVAQLVPAQVKAMLSKSGEELIQMVPLKEMKIDPAIQRSFLILLGAVGFVLLIACANTANLLLARAVARQKEFAVRLALGAGRARLVRQVLTESILLSLLGGCGGLLVAMWGSDWLTSARPWNAVGFWSQYAATFDYFSPRLDLSVLGFNFLLALATGIAFGLAPAWQTSRADVNEMLKDVGSRWSASHSLRRAGVRSVLVVTEIALSLMLLVSAGLLMRSFVRLLNVPLGFEPEGVVTLRLGQGSETPDFARRLLERVQTLPRVESASLATSCPLSGGVNGGQVKLEGEVPDELKKIRVGFNVVTPAFFKTYRITVRQGRGFTESDRIGAPRVAVVNRAFAQRFWPRGDALGRRLQIPYRTAYPETQQWIEVAGVVDDVKYGAVEDANEPLVYLPAWQPTLGVDSLAIRTANDPASVVAAVRKEVRALDPTIPLTDIGTMRERAAKVTSRYRYSAMLMGMFAALALLLSAMGAYGVMAFAVSARTREFGVRIALGAQPQDILRLVISDGIALVLAGVGLGLAGAVAATRVLTSQLYDLHPNDPLTFVIVSALLAAVVLLACYVPARRATRVEPVVALRYE